MSENQIPTARDHVNRIQAALAEMPPGATSVTIEGLSVAISRDEALKELEYWRSIASREDGSRPIVIRTKLG